MTKRILVVDDEQIILDSVRKALRKDDYAIDTELSAAEALKRMEASSYDVVITDLAMPGMDGLELLERIRAMDAGTKTVMVTGYPTIRTALKAQRLGAYEYVTKPFTRQELRSVVVRAIRHLAGVEAANAPDSGEEHTLPTYYILDHAWVRLHEDDTAEIGWARPLAAVVGKVREVHFPEVDTWIEQGRACMVVRAADDVEHSLHAPLSGQVLEINTRILRDPDLASRDPEGEGWLVRIRAQNLAKEIENLVPATDGS